MRLGWRRTGHHAERVRIAGPSNPRVRQIWGSMGSGGGEHADEVGGGGGDAGALGGSEVPCGVEEPFVADGAGDFGEARAEFVP